MRLAVHTYLTFFIIYFANAQNKNDTSEMILKIYLSKEVPQALFQSKRLGNNIYVIKNEVKVNGKVKVIDPSSCNIQNHNILFFPRVYLIGYYINYWIQIDSINFMGNKAIVYFKTIFSSDNWFEENDTPHIIGKMFFKRSKKDSWIIKRKKLKINNINFEIINQDNAVK